MEGESRQNHQVGGKNLATISIPQAVAFPSRDLSKDSVWLDGSQGIVELSWRAGTLQQIRTFVGSTYISRSGKGDDVGGILLGRRDGDNTQVLTWRPIVRGKDATSHFYLNSKEEQSLSKLLQSVKSDSSLENMEVLGWFRSRTKGEPILEEHDIKFHEQFFDKPAQFAMVVRPSHQRPAAAALFVRNSKNEFDRHNPTAKLSLKPGPVALPEESELSESIPGVLLEESQAPSSKPFSWLAALALTTAAAIVAVGCILMLQWTEKRATAANTPESFGFELVFDGQDLKARWNPAANTIMSADTAQLLLGGERLQLSHSELVQGFLRVPLKDGLVADTEVTLKVGNREEVAQLIVAAR